VRRVTLEGANRNLNKIRQEIDRFKATDAGRLRAEYNRLVEGLALRGDLSGKYVFRKVICDLIESTQ
jgi:DNA excision repair protein ERCC-2